MAGEGGGCGSPEGYERRRPETSALHRAVREGWPGLKGRVPKRLEEEVRRYLECGRLCYGFVHFECEDCRAPTLVAFSCKSRGWCPSCTTRRALVTGVELEATLPFVAHRQWTLSLPRALRLVVVKRPALLKVVERALMREPLGGEGGVALAAGGGEAAGRGGIARMRADCEHRRHAPAGPGRVESGRRLPELT